MPPKRSSPLELNPPSASSEDDESEGSEEEQEEPPKPTKTSAPKPPPSDDDEEGSEEEDSDEEKADLAADNEDADSESESGSGSESDNDNEPVKHMIAPRNAPVATEVKPISSKPMSDIPKSKKPTSTTTTASATPAKAAAAAKRSAAEEEENEKKDRKRKRKKVSDIEDGVDEENEKKAAGGAGEEKKERFQRLFTDQDEIILLNKLIEFKKDGHNAANDMGGFLDFVKDSLHINVNKAQLQNKVQRLEKKFKNNANRVKEPGKDPIISKPHELKSYQLSKEIWGDQTGNKDNGAEANHVASEAGVTDKKRRKTQVKSNGAASPKRKVAKSVKSPKAESIEEEDNAKEEDTAGGLEYPYLNQSMQFMNHPMLPPQGLAGLVAKKGWELIGTSNAEAFDKKWKALMIAETKAYLERIEVVRDQTKLMLDVLESSDV